MPGYEHKEKKNIIKRQISIKFTSTDQEINNYEVKCSSTDIFEQILEKIFSIFPKFKSKNIFCLSGGDIVNPRVTLDENKIENDSNILIHEND